MIDVGACMERGKSYLETLRPILSGAWQRFVSGGLLLLVSMASVVQASDRLAIDRGGVDIGQGWTVGYSQWAAGCVTVAKYRDGTRVWLGFSARLGNFIAFSNEGWRSVSSGDSYDITMRAGRGSWRSTDAVGFSVGNEKGVILSTVKIDVLRDIARASGFSVELAGRKIFSGELSGSRRALLRAQSCFEDNKTEADRHAAAGRDNSSGRTTSEPTLSANGTGFYVNEQGFILTNQHVTAKCRAVTVGVPGGNFEKAVVKAEDAANDLALLQVSTAPKLVPFFRTSVKLGESVAVFGYPLTSLLASSGNFTVGYVSAIAGLADDSRQYQISAPVQPGNSGGPLVDYMGNVVGVIQMKLNNDVAQNSNFAIKFAVAQQFLEVNQVAIKSGTYSDKLEPVQLADHLKSFTVKVNCFK